MQRQDTYARTYSQQLPEVQRPSTEDDYAIACVLAENEREAKHVSEPPPDTSLDGQLALQLHEKESNKLLQSTSQQRRKHSRTFRRLLRSLNVTRVIPRLNPGFFPDDTYVSQDRQRLLLRLDMYALQERPVIGDGNCQFRAIADQLCGSQDRHLEVRQKVVEQLCSHPERYRDYVTSDYEQYVSTMSQQGTWGDHVTLQAAADVLATRICVLSSFLDNCVISIQPLQQEGQQQQQQEGEQQLLQQQEQQQQQKEQQQQEGDVSSDLRLPAGIWLAFWAEVHYNSLAVKAPASPSESDDDSSSSDETTDSGKKLLGSKKLRKAAEKLF